jgi:hypothetical protein
VQADLSDRERLFALWLGAAAVMLKVRLELLLLAPAMFRSKPVLAPWLPLAAYQDVLLIALATWAWWTVLPLLKRPLARRAAYIAGWLVGLFAAGYAVLNFEIYRYLQVPLTYQLIVFSKHLDYIRDSLAGEHLYAVLLAPLYALVVAVAIPGSRPAFWAARRAGFTRGSEPRSSGFTRSPGWSGAATSAGISPPSKTPNGSSTDRCAITMKQHSSR